MPIIWVLAVTFVRASILTLYIHIFPPRSFRLTCYLVLIINAGFCIGTIVADCLICQPISYRWDRSIKDGHCGTQKSLDLSIAIVNFILDLAVVTILMPTLWRLKMTVGKKVVLSGIFGMGVMYVLPTPQQEPTSSQILISSSSICALTLYRIYITATMDQPRHKGLAYEMIGLLATLESLLGVISACLPMLRPIFGKLRALFSFGSRGSGAERIDSPTSERNKEPRVARIAATTSVLHQISTGLRKAAGKPTLGHDGGDDEHVLTRMDSRDFAKGSRDGATFTDGDISASVQYARNKVGDAAANVNEIYVRKDIDVDVDAGVSSTPHRPQRY